MRHQPFTETYLFIRNKKGNRSYYIYRKLENSKKITLFQNNGHIPCARDWKMLNNSLILCIVENYQLFDKVYIHVYKYIKRV